MLGWQLKEKEKKKKKNKTKSPRIGKPD